MKKIFLAIFIFAFLLAGCQTEAKISEILPATDTPPKAQTLVSENSIDLSKESGALEIANAGTYTLSGTLADGQILITAAKGEAVTLILSGANITNKTGAAIYATKCDLTISLAENTENFVTDGGDAFVFANAAEEEPNAAIFAKNNLIINGNGALNVNAGFNNGIGAKDNLTIESGNINVTAANHGIRGNDALTILDGNFTIDAGNDGLQTNNDADSTLGNITISGGNFAILAKSKGIKASGNIDISAGIFTIESADDTLHSNANITIKGGIFSLATDDDGIHADGILTVSGGNIDVTKSYEGLEAANIYISDGIITVISTDDGINAAGGTNGAVTGGRFGADNFAGDSYSLNISGGTITLYTTSDGIDSNGTLEILGGTIAIFIGTTRDGDATDVDRGGTIAPALYGSANLKAGAKFAVSDIWSVTLAKEITKYCLILPGIVDAQSYQITADGSVIGNVTATTSIQGMMMGGGNAGGIGGRPGGGAPPGGGFGGGGGFRR
jgi:hypothetical protein